MDKVDSEFCRRSERPKNIKAGQVELTDHPTGTEKAKERQ